MDYLVEASAAEAEAISATLAAVKARQVNGEMEQLPDKEQSPDSTSSSKHSSLIKPDSVLSSNMAAAPGVRLHHRAVSRIHLVICLFSFICIFISQFNAACVCTCYCHPSRSYLQFCTIALQFISTFALQVVVAAETGGALGGMVRQLSIDQFENEGRRVSYGTPENATAARKLLDRQMSINSVPKKVLSPCHSICSQNNAVLLVDVNEKSFWLFA